MNSPFVKGALDKTFGALKVKNGSRGRNFLTSGTTAPSDFNALAEGRHTHFLKDPSKHLIKRCQVLFMPRKNLIRSGEYIYHVTARTHNKSTFAVPLSTLWVWFDQALHDGWKIHGIEVHAFVLMGNHFHLLVKTPRENLDQAMHHMQMTIARKINSYAGVTNQVWGGRYHWCLVTNRTYYEHVYRYVYQNPVRAGFTLKVEAWPFSTLTSKTTFPLYSNLMWKFGGDTGEGHWLNKTIQENDRELLRKGLRRREFKLPEKRYLAPFRGV